MKIQSEIKHFLSGKLTIFLAKIKHFHNDNLTKIRKIVTKNLQKIEFGAVQRFLNLVDLEKR